MIKCPVCPKKMTKRKLEKHLKNHAEYYYAKEVEYYQLGRRVQVEYKKIFKRDL